MIKRWGYFLFLFPLLLSLNDKENELCGNYSIKNSEWGGHKLTLKSDGYFTEGQSGCVYDYQTSGKWSVKKDILILKATERKDLRSGNQIPFKPYTSKYIVIDQALYKLNGRTRKHCDEEFSLVKRDN